MKTKTGIIVMIIIPIFTAALAVSGSFGQDTVGTVHSITLPAIHTKLKAGPGRETVERRCNICHSLDYITMQPGFPKEKWAAIVHKMISVMGAPVTEEDAAVIINYLASEYGTDK